MTAIAAGWDAFFRTWVAPSGRLLVPLLVILLVLLISAHLACGVVVGPATESADRLRESGWTRRRMTYWAGIGAMLAAAWWATAGNAGLHPPDAVRAVAWVGAVVLAVVGVGLVARGRGLALRVQIEGRDGDGRANAMGAHVLARLQQLGSQRPTGIEVPQQTDVSTLPDDALSALPQSDLAKLALRVLRLAGPAAPWLVSVTVLGGGAISVLISRNGRLVDSAVIQFASPAAAADGDAAKAADAPLAAAAAAFTLATLARRHPALRIGLSGATRWLSIFLQVRAASPAFAADPGHQKTLLAQAVEADPGNIAARVALLHVDGRRAADADAASLYARGLDQLLDELMPADGPPRPPVGWEALVIRMLFNLSVAWTHHFLFRVQAGETPVQARDSWERAHARGTRLIGMLYGPRVDPDVDELAEDMRPAAGFLLEAIRAASPDQAPAAGQPPASSARLSLTAVYTRACRYAIAPTGDDLPHALDDLATVAVLDGFRAWARHDPSFHVFRQPGTPAALRARFRRIVGQAVPSDFLELPPFTAYAERLRDFGVRTPEDLLAENPEQLAAALAIPEPQLRRWRGIAELGATTVSPGGDPLGPGLLFLLLAADIDNVARLREALMPGRVPSLHDRLSTAALDYAIEAPPVHEIRRWSPP